MNNSEKHSVPDINQIVMDTDNITGSNFKTTTVDNRVNDEFMVGLNESNNGQPKKKRGRPKKGEQQKQVRPLPTITEVEQGLLPVFGFIGSMLGRSGIEPLSEYEIQSGAQAFAPLVQKYAPFMDQFAMYVAPIMWTGTVIMTRMNSKKKIEKPVEKTETKENVK